VFNHDRKDTHCGARKLKRDELAGAKKPGMKAGPIANIFQERQCGDWGAIKG
jgi:hypothetical protein